MLEIMVGMLIIIALAWIIIYVRNKKLMLQKGGWILISLALLYSLFVTELVISFMKEGTPQAALVMGGIFGFIAIIFWVLIKRFLLTEKTSCNE
jgi:uncharacterized membrane protein